MAPLMPELREVATWHVYRRWIEPDGVAILQMKRHIVVERHQKIRPNYDFTTQAPILDQSADTTRPVQLLERRVDKSERVPPPGIENMWEGRKALEVEVLTECRVLRSCDGDKGLIVELLHVELLGVSTVAIELFFLDTKRSTVVCDMDQKVNKSFAQLLLGVFW